MSLCAIMILAFAGCGSGSSSDENKDESSDATTPQKATIELESNASTGYSWSVSQTPVDLNEDFVDYFNIKDKYIQPEQDDEETLTGAPGTQLFTLTAAKPGDVYVTFDYVASDGESSAYEFTYHLTVNDDLSITFVDKNAAIPHDDGEEVDESSMPACPDPVIK